MNAATREIAGATYKAVRFAEHGDEGIDGATAVREVWPGETRSIPEPAIANSLPYQFTWHGGSVYGMPETFRHALPLRMFTARAAIVVGHDGALEFENGLFHQDSTAFLKPHVPSSLFRRQDDRLWVRSAPETIAPTDKYFLGFNAEWRNYGHVLTDVLPILYFYKSELMREGYKLVVPPLPEAGVHDQLIELLEIDREQLYAMPNDRVRFNDLSFTTAISLWSQTGLLNIAAEALIDRALARAGDRAQARHLPDKLLYLSRQDATTRRLLHEPGLIKRLERLGFEVVLCSQLTLEEQILLFQQAEMVVGPHGAALVNLLFCRPGARALELFPEYCVQPHYRGLAAWRKLQYGYLVGTSFEHENSRVVQDSWGNDFVIDEDLVIETVAGMLASRSSARAATINLGEQPEPRPAVRSITTSVDAGSPPGEYLVSDEKITFGNFDIHLLNGDNSRDFVDRDDVFFMAKNTAYIDGYQELKDDFRSRSLAVRTILEIGIFRGGSAPFLHRLFNAERVVCVDRMPGPVIPLENYRKQHPNVITSRYGINQADRTANEPDDRNRIFHAHRSRGR